MSSSNPIIISKGGGIIGRGSSRIPGTFPSVRYGEQVVSTGVPSLDTFIGGGIPLGSICIIKDTFPSRYGDCVLKSFIAEGATYNHHLYVASGLDNCEETILNDLPSLASSKSQGEGGMHGDGYGVGDMKIAWRYGHQQAQGSTPSSRTIGGGVNVTKDITKFDFSKKTSATELGARNVTSSAAFERNKKAPLDLTPVSQEELLAEIFAVVKNLQLLDLDSTTTSTKSKHPNNLVRICISHCEEQVLSTKFMMTLRAMVRYTNSCAMLTISDVASSSKKISRGEHFADYVISLQAVADEKRRTDLGDIDGICDIEKTASINTLKLVEAPRDLGFSFKKKRLVFHELNLPPEGESTTQREVSSTHRQATTSSSCGSTIKGKSIDF